MKGKLSTIIGENAKRRIEDDSQLPGLGGQVDKAYEEVASLSWRGIEG